jgi:hypothetical protein
MNQADTGSLWWVGDQVRSHSTGSTLDGATKTPRGKEFSLKRSLGKVNGRAECAEALELVADIDPLVGFEHGDVQIAPDRCIFEGIFVLRKDLNHQSGVLDLGR